MKKKLKLGFTDAYDNAKKTLTDILGRYYEIIRDDTNPDYLIFCDPTFGTNNYSYKNCKKILFTGENYRPTYFTYDYAITFDHESSPKHYRLPLYVAEMLSATYDTDYKDFYHVLNRKVDIEYEWDRKTEFCSFVQSNPNCETRNIFFDLLSEYKKVNSAGPHKNNIGYTIPKKLQAKIDFVSKHKFNIAFENGSYPGYVTEKILNTFYSNTIPIYWGSPTVVRDFNPKAFINSHEYVNLGEVVDRVRELDNNKNLYLDMLSQPAVKDNRPNEWMNFDEFYKWFDTFVYEDKL
jgi:hypothetical protein